MSGFPPGRPRARVQQTEGRVTVASEQGGLVALIRAVAVPLSKAGAAHGGCGGGRDAA